MNTPERYLSVSLALLMTLTLIPMSTEAAPPVSGDWTIAESTSETVSGQTITMTGNITVESLGTLTLNKCTILMDCAFGDQYHIEVLTGGTLTMIGCVVRASDASYRYSFSVRTQSQATIRYSSLSDIHNGLELYSNSALVEGSNITACDDGVEIYDSNPRVLYSTIADNDNNGIYIHPGSTPHIQGNDIRGNGGSGIYDHEGTPSILYNDIHDNHDDGIIAMNTPGSYSIGSNNIFRNGGQGIRLEQTSPTIGSNTITANLGSGIFVSANAVQQSNPAISNNVITGNGGDGIHLDNTQVITGLSGNTLHHNLGWGIYSQGGTFTDTGDVFLDSSGIGNYQGRVRQLWDLRVQTTDNCGFYLFNDNLQPNPTWNGGFGTSSHDWGYLPDRDIYNNGTIFDHGSYLCLADRTGSYQLGTASTPLRDNTALNIVLADAPDLEVSDIHFSNPTPATGETVTATLDVDNLGTADASNVDVDIYLTYPNGKIEFQGRVSVLSVSAGGTTQVAHDITFDNGGSYDVSLVVDPDNAIWEEDDHEANYNTYSESITVSGYSVFVDDVRSYIDYPYWNWRSFTEDDRLSVDPGSWRSFRVYTRNYQGNSDLFRIGMNCNSAWTIKASFDNNPATTNTITSFTMNPNQQRYFYIHVQPPDPAPRGSNLDLDLTLISDNDSAVDDTFHFDTFANWIIPEGTSETVSGEAASDIGYSIRVYGTLNLDDVNWKFNNYPTVKDITIMDGGKGVIHGSVLDSTSTNDDWRFFANGELDLRNSSILNSDYGVEVYSNDYPVNVLIEGNTISYSDHDGIVLDGSAAVIRNNTISHNDDAGIDGQNSHGTALIQGNTIEYNQWGVDMELRSSDPVLLSGNTLHHNTYGVLVSSFSCLHSDNNTFYANQYGIHITDHGEVVAHYDIITMSNNNGLWMSFYGTASFYDVALSVSDHSGIRSESHSHLDMVRSQVVENHYMALYCEASTASFVDSTLGESLLHANYNFDDDMLLDSGSDVSVTNCTLERGRIYFGDTASTLTVMWYLRVVVKDSEDNGVAGLPVTISDGQNTTIFDGYTDGTGHSPVLSGMEVVLSLTASVDHSHHTVSVKNSEPIITTLDLMENTLCEIYSTHTFALGLPINVMDADPQGTAIFNISLSNTGSMNDTYYISVSGNASFLPVLDRTTVAAGANDTRYILMNVTIPTRALAHHNESFTVSVNSVADPLRHETVDAFVRVNEVHGLELLALDGNSSVAPSGSIYRSFRVTNTGSVPGTFTLSVPSQSWMASASIDTTTLALDAWEDTTVVVNATCSPGIIVGTDLLTLEASGAGGVHVSTSVNIGIVQVYSATLHLPDPVRLVAGTLAEYTINITNTGNGDDILVLSTDRSFVTFDTDHLDLDRGETGAVTMSVAAPPDMNTTSMNVHVTLAHMDGLTLTQLPFTVEISARSYNISLSTGFTALTLEQGALKSFNVTVRNAGNAPDTISLGYRGVPWSCEFAETRIQLGIGGEQNTVFLMQIPGEESIGARSLELVADLSGITISLPITINVVQRNCSLEWGSQEPVAPGVKQGESVRISLTLTNTGNYTTDVRLRVTDADGLAAPGVSYLNLSRGESRTITVTVTFPAGYSSGLGSPYQVSIGADYGFSYSRNATTNVTVTPVEKDATSIYPVVLSAIIAGILALIVGIVMGFALLKIVGGAKGREEEVEGDGRTAAPEELPGDEAGPGAVDEDSAQEDELPDGEMEDDELAEVSDSELPGDKGAVETWSTTGDAEETGPDEADPEKLDEMDEMEPLPGTAEGDIEELEEISFDDEDP